MQDHKVYTLVRGDRIVGVDCNKKVKKILDDKDKSEEEKLESIGKICCVTTSRDYSDAAFSVNFCANKTIALTALGFWGPHEEESAKYRVKFNIYELSSLHLNAASRLLVSVDRDIEGRNHSVMYVALDEPLKCIGDCWIRIEFMLNGPETCVSHINKTRVDMPGVTFEFGSRIFNSKQIPELQYILLDE